MSSGLNSPSVHPPLELLAQILLVDRSAVHDAGALGLGDLFEVLEEDPQ